MIKKDIHNGIPFVSKLSEGRYAVLQWDSKAAHFVQLFEHPKGLTAVSSVETSSIFFGVSKSTCYKKLAEYKNNNK